MKKIIDRLCYNTETAEEIASYWNGLMSSDFGYCTEKLYKTKNGRWFIHGKGGAASSYRQSLEGGRSWTGGETIVVLTEEEALAWLEQHNETEALEEHFKIVEA
jgi:hypothetical protein